MFLLCVRVRRHVHACERGVWRISQRSSSPTDQLPYLFRIYAPTEKCAIPVSLAGKGELLKKMALQAR